MGNYIRAKYVKCISSHEQHKGFHYNTCNGFLEEIFGHKVVFKPLSLIHNCDLFQNCLHQWY